MSFPPPLPRGAPEEFREIFLWNRDTGKFDIPLEPWYWFTEDYLKVKNRKRLTGSVVTPGTPVTLYTGTYTALSLLIHNPSTVTQTWLIYDDKTALVGAAGVQIAANAILQKELWWMPFETSVRIDASSAELVFTFGGYLNG